jgi:tight adherence protein C
VSRASGVLPDALKGVLASLELGSALDQELKWLAKTLPQRQVIEFSNKLSSSLRRGTPLVQMLTSLAESTRAELRNAQLKQAGRNETRMLIPLVFLILPVTVLFAIYPSIQLISTGNI